MRRAGLRGHVNGCVEAEPVELGIAAEGTAAHEDDEIAERLEGGAQVVDELNEVFLAVPLLELVVVPVQQEQDPAQAVHAGHDGREEALDHVGRGVGLGHATKHGGVEDFLLPGLAGALDGCEGVVALVGAFRAALTEGAEVLVELAVVRRGRLQLSVEGVLGGMVARHDTTLGGVVEVGELSP